MTTLVAQNIACPQCKQTLAHQISQLVCQSCKASYGIEQDVPMLIDQRLIDFSMATSDPSIKQKRYEMQLFEQLYSNNDLADAYNTSIGSEKNFKSPFDKRYDVERENFFKKIDHKANILNIGGISNRELKREGHGSRVINLDLCRHIKTADMDSEMNQWVVGDIEYLPFKDDCFDIILMQYVLHHAVDQEKALKELKRVLKRNGKIFIVEPSSQSIAVVYYYIKKLCLKILGEKGLRHYIGYYGSIYESYADISLFKKIFPSTHYTVNMHRSTPIRIPWTGRLAAYEKYFNVAEALENTWFSRWFGSYVFVEIGKK